MNIHTQKIWLFWGIVITQIILLPTSHARKGCYLVYVYNKYFTNALGTSYENHVNKNRCLGGVGGRGKWINRKTFEEFANRRITNPIYPWRRCAAKRASTQKHTQTQKGILEAQIVGDLLRTGKTYMRTKANEHRHQSELTGAWWSRFSGLNTHCNKIMFLATLPTFSVARFFTPTHEHASAYKK